MISITKKLTLTALLIAFSLGISYLEGIIPISLVVPIFGFKIGLANIVTLFALFYLNTLNLFVLVVLRSILFSFLTGSVSGLTFSLCGGLLSLTAMLLLKRYFSNKISLFGISILGAAFHNIGQILVAFFTLKTASVFYYLPFLLILSVFAGFLTALICSLVLKKVNFFNL